MSKQQPLIGSGWFSTEEQLSHKLPFHDLWLHRLGIRDIVIVDNGDYKLSSFDWPSYCRVIPVHGNLGHVGSMLNMDKPFFSGWSLSWIIPALVAYSENRDFIYVEQDCLPFGFWEENIIAEAKRNAWSCTFGHCPPHIADCEQSLFWVEHDFIPGLVARYMSIPISDGKLLTESKFMRLMKETPNGMGQFEMGVGRDRPLPKVLKSTWYAQKVSKAEIETLKWEGLL